MDLDVESLAILILLGALPSLQLPTAFGEKTSRPW